MKAVEIALLEHAALSDQFVRDLSGTYLGRQASVRFLNDPAANGRAEAARDTLFSSAGARDIT